MPDRAPVTPTSPDPPAAQAGTVASVRRAAHTPTDVSPGLDATTFAALDHAVNVLLLFAFALVGTVPLRIPLLVGALAILVNLLFIVAIRSGRTRTLADPSLTAVQVCAAGGINLLALWLAPQIAYMSVVNLFVLLSFGSLRFTQRGFFLVWFGLSVLLAIVLHAVGARADIAAATRVERWLFWLVLSIAFGRFLAVHAEVSRLRSDIQARSEELARMAAKLADLASRDDLTGLWNRREFMRMLAAQRKRVERRGGGFCVALIDADHFKQVNDRFGHQTGDAVLQELARVFERSRRATDTLARYGGEEFILLLDGGLGEATRALERVRHAVEAGEWAGIDPALRVTVSIGAAAWQPGEDVETTISRADEALYAAKGAGRNRVEADPRGG